MTGYDFANILLSGPCNLRCPDCIGQTLDTDVRRNNLSEFPLRGLDRFTKQLRHYGVRQVSLTGTNTEPQLYRYERELVAFLRFSVPRVTLSLHTNGTLALRKPDTINLYDRVSISIPSFQVETYRMMTGSIRIPDLAGILNILTVPIKISVLVTDDNRAELFDIMARCCDLGIKRLVFRKLYGDSRELDIFPGVIPDRLFGGNPVYLVEGLEVTIWDFERSRLRCLNLFSNGRISGEYTLEKQGRKHVSA